MGRRSILVVLGVSTGDGGLCPSLVRKLLERPRNFGGWTYKDIKLVVLKVEILNFDVFWYSDLTKEGLIWKQFEVKEGEKE